MSKRVRVELAVELVLALEPIESGILSIVARSPISIHNQPRPDASHSRFTLARLVYKIRY